MCLKSLLSFAITLRLTCIRRQVMSTAMFGLKSVSVFYRITAARFAKLMRSGFERICSGRIMKRYDRRLRCQRLSKPNYEAREGSGGRGERVKRTGTSARNGAEARLCDYWMQMSRCVAMTKLSCRRSKLHQHYLRFVCI